MKKIFLNTLFLIIIFNFKFSYTQEPHLNPWVCGTNSNGQYLIQGPIGTTSIDLVVAFLDFPDGRLSNGNPPSTVDELYQVQNADAVSQMGYLSNDGATFNPIPQKYTYDIMWNYYFSINTYFGEAHPDWLSHGRFGLPVAADRSEGDTARAWGSFKDYFLATSYGNLTINAFQTHTTNSGMYNFGIVNNIKYLNGNICIKPIELVKKKGPGGYNIPNTPDIEIAAINIMLDDAGERLLQLHGLDPSDPNYIEFDISNYTGHIIYVFAGGTNAAGGITDNLGGRNTLVREKLCGNSLNEDQYYKWRVINGPTIACHEFGHQLGFDHSHIGNYCLMDEGTDNQNCPTHLNMLYKLQAGWIDPSRVRIIRTAQDILDLPPSEYNGDCALLTIYGSPGYDNNYFHSQFFIFENRRMLRDDPNVKFDKKFVWKRNAMPNPDNTPFNGGCLVTRSDLQIISADITLPVNPLDEGNSKHFWGVQSLNSAKRDMTDAFGRTYSSLNLRTGININNIYGDYNGNLLKFSPSWSLGEPPDYNFVLHGQTNIPNYLNLNGYVFIQDIASGISFNIQPGTILDFFDTCQKKTQLITEANVVADGMENSIINFRGAGYNDNQQQIRYRSKWNGIKIKQTELYGNSENTIFRYCDFNDADSICLYIQKINTNSSLVLENLSFSHPNSGISLLGSNNRNNRAILTSYHNVNPTNLGILQYWQFDITNDLNISSNGNLEMK